MPDRRPLVNVNGFESELPIGDRIGGQLPAVSNGQFVTFEQLPLSSTLQLADWSGTYEIGGAFPLTENITILLPNIIAGDVNRTLTLKRMDRTAFTVTVQAPAGQTTTLTGPTDLNAYGGRMTFRVTSLTASQQIANPPDTASSISGAATITIPYAQNSYEQTISVPGVLSTQSVMVWLVSTTDFDENEQSFLEGVTVSGNCQTNAITFIFSSRDFESGPIKLMYQVN
jgi:hypothetical protein